MTPMAIGGNALARKEVWILPTKITDRFGNSVTYTYDTVNKWQLQRIVSNDESGTPRQITFSYLTPGSTTSRLVSSVSDGTRTWTYRYGGSDGRGPLTTVTMPDNSTWQLAELEKLATGIDYLGDGNCEEPGMVNRFTLTGTATHPSGARGEFVLNPVRHARVGVPRDCREYLDPYAAVPYQPNQFDTFALTKKTITGPGLPAMEWVTTYPAPAPGWAPWNGQNGSKQVEVRGPDGHVTRHIFGTVFMQDEGQVQAVEHIDAIQGLLRRTSTQYTQPVSPRGTSDQRRGDGEMAARVYEVNRREIAQQSTTFLWQATAFNAYAQPTTVVKSSSQGTSRTEVTTYDNNLSRWVLGQIATVTETSTTPGTEIVRNGYNGATANLESISRFTLPEKTFTYHADGNVAGEKDGRGYETTYTNYRRGIPQNVSFADGKTTSASINNLGGIDWTVDPTGARTDFGYDAMGRFASISYPGGDPVTWKPTTLVFEQVWMPEFDLPAGHWRQTVTTGAGIEANYFDAFWRPVYSVRWDNDNRPATERLVMHQYDADGRSTFDSYSVRSYGGTPQGVRRGYDALGRLVFTETDSELGLLRSTVWYDPAVFRKTQTDALTHSTTYEFQAFDQPSEDAVTRITAPEGVLVTIGRDLFDKPLSITRSGAGKSLTRSYQYDRYQRLTKTAEPETGATLQGYDAANNVVCRASGLSLAAAIACDDAAVPLAKRTTFGYDERNRLKSTTYGDGSPAITRTYTADGLPDTISSGGSVWTYAYNKRRLNTGETLAYGGNTYRIGRSYDANGSLAQLAYPFDLTLNYNPNALGEARRIGGYATDIQYHPNGAVAGFVYANGIRRELQQYSRGLPKQAIDTGVLNEFYVYDANGNVTQIDDRQQQLASRTMTYDDLDRLRNVSAPSLWGTAVYTYDAIDNLVSTSISAGANARTLTHAFNSTTNRLDSTSGGPANFNFAYAYDDQGNVTQRGAQTYRFDQGNRLTAADGRASYAYDGLGHRVSTVGTDQVNTLQIYTKAGQLLYSGPPDGSGTKYIYLNNHVIAEQK